MSFVTKGVIFVGKEDDEETRVREREKQKKINHSFFFISGMYIF